MLTNKQYQVNETREKSITPFITALVSSGFSTLIKLPLFLVVLCLLPFASTTNAQITPESLFDESPTFLKVDEAFGFDFEQRGDQLVIKWDIAPDYYLYKKQFKTATKDAVVGEPSYPPHEQIEDEFFGISDVFFYDMEMTYPIIKAKQDGSVKIRYQGCAKAGLCYPPTTKVVYLEAFDSGLLSPEEAYSVSAQKLENGQQVSFSISLVDDYYLLADSVNTDSIVYELGEPKFVTQANASSKQVEHKGLTKQAYINSFEIMFPVLSTDSETPAEPSIDLFYQVCHVSGVCFLPSTYTASSLDAAKQSNAQAADLQERVLADNSGAVSEQFVLAEMLTNDNIFISLGVLLIIGLGLAFTPCVYPMYPILSSIVIGKGKKEIKASHAFALSFTYVQGMAITYSIIGLIVASAGVQFQAALQNPWLLGVFIILFVALAIAMFGVYEIQLPNKWQNKLNSLSDGQKQGNFVGVFIMGVVSGLVASPCTTAPLTAILIVVASSDSLVFGFSALYALSIGMGIPLILFGVTGGKLLPRAGNWMNVIKVTFGFMMLTVAILFVERIVVALWTDLLWATLGLALFTYWYTLNQSTNTSFAKGIRTVISMGGIIISILFSIQTLQKLDWIPTIIEGTGQANHATSKQLGEHPEFMVVKDLSDFKQKLADANNQGKPVMIDLYADWCVACKEFEKYTFPDPQVVEALSEAVWMQIDLTDNTPSNYEFQTEFGIVGLPTIMFFNQKGEELSRSRVTGFMQADAFAKHARNTLPKN